MIIIQTLFIYKIIITIRMLYTITFCHFVCISNMVLKLPLVIQPVTKQMAMFWFRLKKCNTVFYTPQGLSPQLVEVSGGILYNYSSWLCQLLLCQPSQQHKYLPQFENILNWWESKYKDLFVFWTLHATWLQSPTIISHNRGSTILLVGGFIG